MENQTCIFLGIKVKPGPIDRHKLENYGLDNTVDSLKIEAEKKSNVPSASLGIVILIITYPKLGKETCFVLDQFCLSKEINIRLLWVVVCYSLL